MTPGPTLIYRCPSCDGLFARSTIGSGNTFGATFRSDGQMNARMLPKTPPLIACPSCSATVCLIGAKPEAAYRRYFGAWGFAEEPTSEEIAWKAAQQALAEQYSDVCSYAEVSLQQCLDFVKTQNLEGRAVAVRMFIWHRVNDERFVSPRPFTHEEAKNLKSLLDDWDPDREDGVLLKAEMLRELGKFDRAVAVLDRDFSTDIEAKAEQIMQAIERRDDQPFFFVTDVDDGDIDFAWAWRARRYKPDQPDDANIGSIEPPNFHISNRDWWVKVLGMCSHNWALIETQSPSVTVVYFFHDMGTTLRPNGFKLGQTKGRSAVVDSLNFGTVEEAQQALRDNGFEPLVQNPGPWFGFEPTGHFYDARTTEEGVYSRAGNWQ